MKVFYTTDHDMHYPVGAASIVVAETVERARELLDQELLKDGLKPSSKRPYDLIELDLSVESAEILVNGNY